MVLSPQPLLIRDIVFFEYIISQNTPNVNSIRHGWSHSSYCPHAMAMLMLIDKHGAPVFSTGRPLHCIAGLEISLSPQCLLFLPQPALPRPKRSGLPVQLWQLHMCLNGTHRCMRHNRFRHRYILQTP